MARYLVYRRNATVYKWDYVTRVPGGFVPSREVETSTGRVFAVMDKGDMTYALIDRPTSCLGALMQELENGEH